MASAAVTWPETDDRLDANVAELRAAVVGHRIVRVETKQDGTPNACARLTLDDGATVRIGPQWDCCAYTELRGVIERLPGADHVITDVRTDSGYETWFIVADAGDVLQLNAEWCEGTGYYAYGFDIVVNRAG